MIKPITINVEDSNLAKKARGVDISPELKKEIIKNTLCDKCKYS